MKRTDFAEPKSRLRAARQALGLTLVQASVAAGCTPDYFSRMERKTFEQMSRMKCWRILSCAHAVGLRGCDVYPELHAQPKKAWAQVMAEALQEARK